MKSKILKRAMAVLIAVAVTFTCYPAVTGTMEADAASRPGKPLLSASMNVSGSINISWSKVKKSKGYQLYKNGKKIKKLPKSDNTVYTDKNVKPGERYIYAVKAYKKTKVKKWYNKKTKKWTKKKPARKYRGKRKKKTVLKYSKSSNKVTVVIPAASSADDVPVSDLAIQNVEGDEILLTWNGPKEANIYRSSIDTMYSKRSYIGKSVTGKFQYAYPFDLDKYTVEAGRLSLSIIYREDGNNTVVEENTSNADTRSGDPDPASPSTDEEQVVPDDNSPDVSAEPFVVDKDITLKYSGVDLFLGEKWDSAVESMLSAVSSGHEKYNRSSFYRSRKDNNTYSGTLHLFDTGDYDNFLKVEVAEDQIVGWQTIAPVQGTSHGITLERGKYYNSKDYPNGELDYYKRDLSYTKQIDSILNNGFEINANLIAGFKSFTGSSNTSALKIDSFHSTEKIIGLHYINAMRVFTGHSKLTYDDILDGGTNTVTISEAILRGEMYYDGDYENIGLEAGTYRYGAQPAAETLYANKSKGMTHYFDIDGFTEGPMGSMDMATRSILSYYASGCTKAGYAGFFENCSGYSTSFTGESFLTAFADSEKHMKIILTDGLIAVGMGYCNGALVEQFLPNWS